MFLLGFDVDSEERTGGGVWGEEIADETELASEFDMAGAAAAVDDHRADGSFVGIFFADFEEAVVGSEFGGGFFGVAGFGAGIDDMSGEEGIFDVVPAATCGVAVGAGGGDFGGVNHAGVVFELRGLGAEEGNGFDVELLGDAGLVEGGSGNGMGAGSGGG